MLRPIANQARSAQSALAHRLLNIVGLISVTVMSAIMNTAYALDSDRDQPVHLEADHATYNQQTGVTVYDGHVVVTQGTIKVEADKVVANLDDSRSIRDVTATGKPAKFQQKVNPDKGIVYGEGNQVYYDAKTAQITLTGNAKITQDGSSFNGNTLRYGMNQGDIEGSGNTQQRVVMTIPPSATRTNTPKPAASKLIPVPSKS